MGRRKLFQVEGDSMLPSLLPQQRLIVKPLPQAASAPEDGSVVVCRHPDDAALVITKRVWRSQGQLLDLRGDNPLASTDSRHFGRVPLECVIGVVTAVIPSTGVRSDGRQ
tara:strand:- start:1050 stop:1379 length:330 start_codon:yes stop_codon:yes gene_type:complete